MTVTLVLASMVGTWGASTAEATPFRFWAYWLSSDTGWSFSNQGATRRPADGTVDGWRFAVSEASSSTTPPRHTASFARLCGSTAPQEGKKRVGLVVDFGTTTEAPDGETPPANIATCVVAPADANGYAVLAAAVQLRTDAGLICGMNGYPATECGVSVADPATSPSAAPTKGSGGTGDGGSAGTRGGGSSDPTTNTSPTERGSSTTPDDKSADPNKQKKKSEKQDDRTEKSAPDADDDLPTATGQVVASTAAASVPAAATGSPLGLVVGAGIVVTLLTAALVVRRRRT